MKELLKVLSRTENPRKERKIKRSLKDVIIIVQITMLGNTGDGGKWRSPHVCMNVPCEDI